MKIKGLLTNKLYLLVIISVAIRLAVVATYAPIGYSDTGWYYKFAKEIVSMDFSNYDGARTPVYPLIIALGFFKWRLVWLIQLLFGIANASFLYLIVFKATNNAKFSFWTGIAYNISLILLFFESNLLTETICIFFLLLSALLLQKILTENKSAPLYFYLSAVISLAILTRPTFLYFFPLILIFLIYDYRKNIGTYRFLYKKVTIYFIPFIIIVGGWSTFNKIKVDYFGPTTLTGFHFIEHSGAFIEYAPDSYSDIKKIYLKHREVKIQETGEQTCTIYMAYPEIQSVKNYTIAQVSKELTSVSFWLFYNYPGLYFSSVLKAFFDFWYLPNFIDYWDLTKLKLQYMAPILGFIVNTELYIWIALNFIFVAAFLYNIYLIFRKKNFPNSVLILFLSSAVISLSFVQALVQYGDNWRFSVALKPYIILVFALLYFCFKIKLLKKRSRL